jgi:integrase/recombinase XerD
LPLDPAVLEALAKIPKTGDYYFWSGTSTRKTVINVWAETFQRLFERAEIKGGHSHKLRHTFAVGLLQRGVSMENVSTLLAHQSLRVTEKYYASWVPGRQQHLEAAVRGSWREPAKKPKQTSPPANRRARSGHTEKQSMLEPA